MPALMERWTHAGPIKFPMTLEQLEQEEARAAATVGAATPLGLASLATALLAWSSVNAGWWANKSLIAAVPLLLLLGGLVPFVAAMWSFRKGDTFEATWFGSTGGVFSTVAVYTVLGRTGAFAGINNIAQVTGVLYGCFAFIVLFLAVAALRVNAASFLILILQAAAFALLMLEAFINTGGILAAIGGWCGIVSSVVAFYTAAALVINSVNMGSILPVGSLPADSQDHRVQDL